MIEPRPTGFRWTLGKSMLAVAGTAFLLGLPATFGQAGSIVLGFILGSVAAAVIPAMLVCVVQSRFPSRRDVVNARLLAASGLILDILAWGIFVWFRDFIDNGAELIVPVAFMIGYVAFLLAAVAGLIQESQAGGMSIAKFGSLIVVLTTLPFAIGAGMVVAAMLEAMAGRR